MNTSAMYQANWTETVGGVVRTRFCRQTDRPPARPTDRLIHLGGGGYNYGFPWWNGNSGDKTITNLIVRV